MPGRAGSVSGYDGFGGKGEVGQTMVKVVDWKRARDVGSRGCGGGCCRNSCVRCREEVIVRL